MTIHTAICDDEKTEREYLTAYLRRWAEIRGHGLCLDGFDSAESFMFRYEEDKSFDILLLDIQMKKMDGVVLAKRIRQDNFAVQLVFVTGFSDYIAEGYEVSALHYLIKPVNEEKLFAVLDRAVINLNKTEPYLLIDTDSENIRIPFGEILYCESFAHSTAITTVKAVYVAKLSISEVESRLDSGFVRCHRSYIAGIKHIERISKTDVILDSGKAVPLSRRSYNEVNQAFIRYFRGNM